MGEGKDFQILIHGIDTLQCAYFLESRKRKGIDFELLGREKESIKETRAKEPKRITLGNSDFLLHAFGSSSGYPIIISNEDFKIEMGEFNNPNFFVTFRSQGIWGSSVFDLHEKFIEWAGSVGYEPCGSESISRIDYCFDYSLSEIDFDEDWFVSRSTKDSMSHTIKSWC